jgi:thiol-disulfide isomerase/thioredoxin
MFEENNNTREPFSGVGNSSETSMKRIVIGVIAAFVVASIAVVAIGRYQRVVPRSISSGLGLSGAPGSTGYLLDTLMPAESAPAAADLTPGNWVNSEALTLDKLRGRVVLVEFWTFGCYNCRNTLPHVKKWDEAYRERGLTIVGVHTPETDSEYSIDNVRREVNSLGIKFPVITDNDYKTWNAYGVEAWPSLFVLDKQGRIRWVHVGEGRYQETENVIKALLAG